MEPHNDINISKMLVSSDLIPNAGAVLCRAIHLTVTCSWAKHLLKLIALPTTSTSTVVSV